MKVSYSNYNDYTANTAGCLFNSISFNQLNIDVAIDWLYDKGYLTEEEKKNHSSERLCDITTAPPNYSGHTIVMLFFDDNEWFITVEIDNYLTVVKAELNDGIPHIIWP